MLKVEIDSHSGFCGGVIRTISSAERFLEERGGPLYSLGAIVHNEEELARLHAKGLVTINDLGEICGDCFVADAPRNDEPSLLIRAHGEPPSVYAKIKELNINLIDCTCPVVLSLQKAIRLAYAEVSPKGGKLVLYGKKGHPEVLGLVGQVGGDVCVVSTLDQAKDLIANNLLRTDRDIELFSQTTMDPNGYEELAEFLRSNMTDASLYYHKTICSQVASRHRQLSEFARIHDVIVFVTGRQSSNGQVLSDLCLKENPRTYIVGSEKDLQKQWFTAVASVGVCGATSTPKWLLEKVAQQIFLQ